MFSPRLALLAIVASPFAMADDTNASDTRVKPASDLRPSLVAIPAGRFQMGSPSNAQRLTLGNFIGNSPGADVAARSDEFPMHEVMLSAFEMCSTEVTRGQLAAATEGACDNDCDLPIIQVSWHDAVGYLNALTQAENASASTALTPCYEGEGDATVKVAGCTGYRLPTEAEWEYAARAGTSTIWPHGDDPKSLKKYAWYDANAKKKPHPVAKLKPNPWGLYDMFGNAGEWVEDWYGPYKADPATDPVGPPEGEFAIQRGGDFKAVSRWSRAASRDKWGKSNRSILTSGFRCARSGG